VARAVNCSLTAQIRSCNETSYETGTDGFSLLRVKYFPVTLSTAGDVARYHLLVSRMVAAVP